MPDLENKYLFLKWSASVQCGLSVWLDRRHIQNKYGAAYTHFFKRWKKEIKFHGRKIKINNNSEYLLILKVCAGH